jgi:hypothetical protein
VKKFFSPEEAKSPVALITIFGSALVGSLAYTLSESWKTMMEPGFTLRITF